MLHVFSVIPMRLRRRSGLAAQMAMNLQGILSVCGHVWSILLSPATLKHELFSLTPFPRLYLVQAFVSLFLWYSPDFGTC